MSGDKRSVATDALEVLGTKITNKKVGRDAVHLACLPVICADDVIRPGDHIGLTDDGKASVSVKKKIGIADPFIQGWIKQGDEFLLIVYPRKIESLRHVWSHPDVPDEPVAEVKKFEKDPIVEAQERLTDIAVEVIPENVGRHRAYEFLTQGMDDGYISDGSTFEGHGKVDIPDEAWDLFEVIFGRRARAEKSYDDGEVYFSCSC